MWSSILDSDNVHSDKILRAFKWNKRGNEGNREEMRGKEKECKGTEIFVPILLCFPA
jgi:hypothetical protein